MRFFSSLFQKFGFTRNEIRVILFLAVTFLIGLAIRWYNQPGSAAGAGIRQFDYSRSDSIFLERSKKLAALSSPEKQGVSRMQPKETPPRKSDHTELTLSSINLNNATKDQLMMLPGIGESYAERIILYREDHGLFTSVEDLTQVKGIGKKTFDRIKPFLTLK